MASSLERNERRLALQRAGSQMYRDAKKRKFNADVAYYNMLNDMHKVFPPQEWCCNEFKQHDKPLDGERKIQKRIASANSRRRLKLMEAELQNRIEFLSNCNQPTYEPPFYFPLSPEELVLPPLFPDLPPIIHSEIKIAGDLSNFGSWIL